EVQATSYLAASERMVSFSNKDMFSVIFKAITFSFSIKYMEALAKEVVVEACHNDLSGKSSIVHQTPAAA
nr:hypothetical protein [Lachnospiraceae bacterium]